MVKLRNHLLPRKPRSYAANKKAWMMGIFMAKQIESFKMRVKNDDSYILLLFFSNAALPSASRSVKCKTQESPK